MIVKLASVLGVMALGALVSLTTWGGASPRAGDCCRAGGDCCLAGNPCCDCCPASDCCYPGSPCCDDCCAGGSACCPAQACCGTATRTTTLKGNCCAVGHVAKTAAKVGQSSWLTW